MRLPSKTSLISFGKKSSLYCSILRHVAYQLGYDSEAQLEELYEKTAWYFDRKMKKKAASYDVFKKAVK